MRGIFGWLLFSVLAPAWACTDPGGIGGTGIDGGGIGGTGQQAEAEIGVIGVVTGFASICVNGIEVHYDASTPVSMNGETASAGALGVGKVVAVRAVGSGTQVRARSIDIVDAAVGPLTAVESPGTQVQVLGQRVRISSATVLGGDLSRERLAGARVGDVMRVSGLRAADGAIMATRIETAPRATRARAADFGVPGPGRFLVQGYVTDVQPQVLRVGATRFNVTAELGAQLNRGQLVRISGRSEGGNRIVERADFLTGPFDIRPQRTLRSEPRPTRGSGDGRSGRDGDEGDRSGRSGRDSEQSDRSGRSGPERAVEVDRSGRSGPERVERPERSDRSGRSERPERVDRSGSGGSSGRH